MLLRKGCCTIWGVTVEGKDVVANNRIVNNNRITLIAPIKSERRERTVHGVEGSCFAKLSG